jgi:hypothetical protein
MVPFGAINLSLLVLSLVFMVMTLACMFRAKPKETTDK